jgi:RES domain-containing protein
MKAYRLFAPWRGPTDAEGAFRWGGRWNSPGTALLYAASSLSLACLEILVHLRSTANIPELVNSEFDIPDDQIRLWIEPEARIRAILESEVLTRETGDNWIAGRRGRSVYRLSDMEIRPVFQVPSAVVPQEWNYLIDPEAVGLIRWSTPKDFRMDSRLIEPGSR